MLETRFRGHIITQQDVLNAFAQFNAEFPDTNSYRNWVKNKSYHHAIEYQARLYPPKFILSIITNEDITDLDGGNDTNRVFQDLDFKIVPK